MNCTEAIYLLEMINRLEITKSMGGLISAGHGISMAEILAEHSKTYVIVREYILNFNRFNIPSPWP